MKLLWDNLINRPVGAVQLSTDCVETAGYEVVNLINYHLSKFYEYNPGGHIFIDNTNNDNISDFIIAGYSLESGSVLLEASTTADFAVVDLSINTFNEKNKTLWANFPTVNYKYWRISAPSKMYAGYLFFGEGLYIGGIDPAFTLNYNSTSSVKTSLTGQTYGNKGIEYFSSSFTLPIITDYHRYFEGKEIATREDLLVFWKSNLGATPVFLNIAEDSPNFLQPILGMVAQNSLAFTLDRTQGYYELKFKFVETK